jgi:DNA polymerase IV
MGSVRSEPSILHVDLDAFFAAVEQRDKPSLRGKPVVVGGIGQRGVVSTASYEARRYGVRSAMSTAEARSRCPHAAFLGTRFPAYKRTSVAVMARLRALSPLVEQLSVDEAFVDLAAAGLTGLTVGDVTRIAADLKADIAAASGGLTASVGAATSKLVAKIASDLDKPNGTVVVPAGTEAGFLAPMQVTVIPGVGPATAQRLGMTGVRTVGDLQQLPVDELVRQLGSAHGTGLSRLAMADDDRPVVSDREAKSVSIEDTFDSDIADRALLAAIAERMAHRVAERLRKAQLSGRTITVKTRMHDFTTHTRSQTCPAGSGCSASACRRWPTGSRTTCSPTTRSASPAPPGSMPRATTRCSIWTSRWPPAARATTPARTCCTPCTGRAGSGARAAAG